MTTITAKEAERIYRALRRHDGQSLHPELADPKAWRELTEALDNLRLGLMDIMDEAEGKVKR